MRPRSALGPQVHRAHARASTRRASTAGATVPLVAGHARAGRDRRGLQHVRRPTPGAGAQRSLDGFGTGLGGARARPERGDRGAAAAAAATSSRWPRTSPTRDAARALLQGPGRRRGRGGAGGRGAGRAVREPGHHVHRPRQRRAPVPPGVHLRAARRRYDTAIREFPRQRPFLRNSAAFFRELRPGRRDAAGDGAGRWPTRSRSASRRCPRRPALNRRLAGVFDSLGRVRRGPARAARHRAAARRPPSRCGPRSRSSRRPRPPATTLTLLLPQRRRACCPRATPTAPGSGSSSSPRPSGPNNEGGPSSAPGERARRRTTTCTLNPYPNTASPGSDHASARRATRTTLRAASASATCRATRAPVTDGQPRGDDE